jgi:hypothetical protein
MERYIAVKISQLCKMIEDSIHGGKYPLDDEQKRFANSLQVMNRSDSDDLKSSEIKIEVRIQGLYIILLLLPILYLFTTFKSWTFNVPASQGSSVRVCVNSYNSSGETDAERDTPYICPDIAFIIDLEMQTTFGEFFHSPLKVVYRKI